MDIFRYGYLISICCIIFTKIQIKLTPEETGEQRCLPLKLKYCISSLITNCSIIGVTI